MGGDGLRGAALLGHVGSRCEFSYGFDPCLLTLLVPRPTSRPVLVPPDHSLSPCILFGMCMCVCARTCLHAHVHTFWGDSKLPVCSLPVAQVIKAVEDGFRLPPPRNCPLALHRLMLDCWQKDPGERPRFSQIHSLLSRMGQDPEPPKSAVVPCPRYLPLSPWPGMLDGVVGAVTLLFPHLTRSGATAHPRTPFHAPLPLTSRVLCHLCSGPSTRKAAWEKRCGRSPNTLAPDLWLELEFQQRGEMTTCCNYSSLLRPPAYPRCVHSPNGHWYSCAFH